MIDYAVIVAIIGMCFFWGAWRERSNGNRRDGGLLLGMGLVTMLGSVGIFVSGA